MKTKLIAAPYYYYNAFMPPLGLSLVSAALKAHGIAHDTDDLYVRLYRAVLNGSVNLQPFVDGRRVRAFLERRGDEEIGRETRKIMALCDVAGYDVVCFSAHQPPLSRVAPEAIIACLIALIKETYGPKVICNFRLDGYGAGRLVDHTTWRIDDLVALLKTGRLGRDAHKEKKSFYSVNEKYMLARPRYPRLPARLYTFTAKTPNAEFTVPSVAIRQLRAYRHLTQAVPRLLPYLFIDGCQGRCAFCERAGHPGFRVKDPAQVVRDLKALSSGYGTRDFMFMNCDINPTRKVASDFADAVVRAGLKIRFTDCAIFQNLDEATLEKLKKAGAVRLVFGLESASLKIKKYIGKVIDLKHAGRILKACYRLGIWAEVDLLIGLPHERPSDIVQTLAFLSENDPYIRSVNLNRFVLKKESLMHLAPGRYGIKNVRPDPDYGSGYDEIGGLTWRKKKEEMERRYYRFLGCLHPNKADYLRPCHFVFILAKHYKTATSLNRFLDKVFFSGGNRIKDYIKDLKGERRTPGSSCTPRRGQGGPP